MRRYNKKHPTRQVTVTGDNKQRSQRQVCRRNAAAKEKSTKEETKDKIIYHDGSYRDKTKRAFTAGLAAAKERIASAKKRIKLPDSINTLRRNLRTTAVLLNKDGRQRDFLPDKPGRHCLLVHRDIASALVSSVCMFVRITANEDAKGKHIDGSWAIVPAQYEMINATTIQHLRRRPFFFLRRYWYEISFDGRVQPAHLLFDYHLDPERRKLRLYVTREYVPVRGTGAENDYFRLWLNQPPKE